MITLSQLSSNLRKHSKNVLDPIFENVPCTKIGNNLSSCYIQLLLEATAVIYDI